MTGPKLNTDLITKGKKLSLPKAKFYPAKGYVGVFYLKSAARTQDGTMEEIYYVRYRDGNGGQHFERVGGSISNKMTPSKASTIRALRSSGKEPTNRGRRAENVRKKEAAEIEKLAEKNKWTVTRLWDDYVAHRYDGIAPATERSSILLYIEPNFGDKTPAEISTFSVEQFKASIKKLGLAPGTVARITALLRRLIIYGVGRDYYPAPAVRVKLPKVPNDRETEFLKSDELARLYAVLDAYPDRDIADLVRLALWTGMRKSELFRLEWEHLDMERGFIRIVQSKGGTAQSIPICDEAWAILYDRHLEKHKYPELVFPSPRGLVRQDVKKHSNGIKTAAKLPASYRLFHGSRHHYASTLVSAGIDLYTVSKLLTHKDLTMTARYSHLSAGALRNAVNITAPAAADKRKEETA